MDNLGNRVIAEKYEIIDTLFSSELQSIFLAKLSGAEDPTRFIVNEFKDTEIIYSMKDNFSKEKCGIIRNIVETIYEDFCFFVVCNICTGPTMETYLSDNNLRLTEKMYLTDSFLSQLIDIEKLSPFIVYSLCDINNLAVTGRRNICFNCNLKITEDMMSVSRSDVSRRAGEIICCIFSNTAAADLNHANNYMPPALFPIVQNCLEGKYEYMAKVYNDFKSLLLYSVFMGGGSVDNQIRKNYQKAKTKRRLTPLRRLAAMVLILLLAGGAWLVINNPDILTFNRSALKNTKPTAQFTADKNQIYEGETVVFTDQSRDPDAGDSIASYLWVISKDNAPVYNSPDRNITFTFHEAGKYEVHLVVADTHNELSNSVKIYIDVLPKLILPDVDASSGEGNEK
ncbi:MAG TPA: PKD domain-containing protein [Bacillota bacterium]|nr:PKD domain-containing protein [Bacillota bacterium]HOR87140.1 PKD domain-containing protein [Bacillota bacterium]HPL54008.1 PKD domain-containing protein [Bacillota bacterium]